MVWKGDASGRRLARSLVTLIDQVDAMWPARDRSSDGSIGDLAHQATQSDHNPNTAGVVTAIDLDRDITASFHARRLAEALVASRDPRIKYIISNGEIISSKVSPWVWRPYNGPNAHREHIHISVDGDPALYDDPRPWKIDGAQQPARPGLFTGITATVFGGPTDKMSGAQTAYGNLVAPGWWDRPGVALPARFGERPLPRVRVTYNGRSVDCPVMDVGPWNINDPYWKTGTRPQAETGTDMTGRRTNKAGIDLTPAAAAAIGLPGKGLVDWEFIGENQMGDTPTQNPDQVLARIDALATQVTQLVSAVTTLVVTLRGGTPAPVPVEPPKPVDPTPPAPPPTTTPILQNGGVQLGGLGLLLSAILQSTGSIDVTQSGTPGQLLPILSAGSALLGVSGTFGTVVNALKLFGSVLGKLSK